MRRRTLDNAQQAVNTVALWRFDGTTTDVVSALETNATGFALNSDILGCGMSKDVQSNTGISQSISFPKMIINQYTFEFFYIGGHRNSSIFLDFMPKNEDDYPYLAMIWFSGMFEKELSIMEKHGLNDNTRLLDAYEYAADVTADRDNPNHYAICIDIVSNAVTVWFNGVNIANVTTSNRKDNNLYLNSIRLSKEYAYYSMFYDLRVSNFIRYTENFTPPTYPLQID